MGLYIASICAYKIAEEGVIPGHDILIISAEDVNIVESRCSGKAAANWPPHEGWQEHSVLFRLVNLGDVAPSDREQVFAVSVCAIRVLGTVDDCQVTQVHSPVVVPAHNFSEMAKQAEEVSEQVWPPALHWRAHHFVADIISEADLPVQ